MEDPIVDMWQISLVLVAHNHNPTVLNPDFLRNNGIAGADWTIAANPLCTDVAARVQYTNGVSVTSQPDKVVFAQCTDELRLDRTEVLVAEMAALYAETLSHVDYRATGMNVHQFERAAAQEAADDVVRRRYMRDGAGARHGHSPTAIGLQFVYREAPVVARVTVNSGLLTREDSGERIPAVLYETNVHRDLDTEASVEERALAAAGFARSWPSLMDLVTELVERVLIDGAS